MGGDLEAKDGEEWTPLHVACNSGNFNSIVLLVDKGANIKAKTIMGYTPIYLARDIYPSCEDELVRLQRLKCIDLLIAKGEVIPEELKNAINELRHMGKYDKLLIEFENGNVSSCTDIINVIPNINYRINKHNIIVYLFINISNDPSDEKKISIFKHFLTKKPDVYRICHLDLNYNQYLCPELLYLIEDYLLQE